MSKQPDAIVAMDAPVRAKPSNYPEPFASLMTGRVKRPLSDVFGITNFGVNLTVLPPNAVSALHHRHTKQDEFVYVIEGNPTLITEAGERQLEPGMVAGFAANGTPHHLENRTKVACVLLEVGDRSAGDEVTYPADDLCASMDHGGRWRFTRKDGRTYSDGRN